MEYTPRSSNEGGRIVTKNPALFNLLTERTQDKEERNRMDPGEEENQDQLQKIYVDSPVFDDEDDEKYKYVSTNVEDFDENQLKAFMMDPDPLDELVERTAAQTPTRGNTSLPKEPEKSDNTQGYDGQANINPFSALMPGDDEDEELRKEQEYQNSLLSRIKDQKKQAENFEIPKLDLSDEEDNPRDSLDPTLSTAGGKFHEINLRDSLEMDQMQKAKDQERLRRIMEDNDDQGFTTLIGDNLNNPPKQQNQFRLNQNEVSPGKSLHSRGSPIGGRPYKEPSVNNYGQHYHDLPQTQQGGLYYQDYNNQQSAIQQNQFQLNHNEAHPEKSLHSRFSPSVNNHGQHYQDLPHPQQGGLYYQDYNTQQDQYYENLEPDRGAMIPNPRSGLIQQQQPQAHQEYRFVQHHPPPDSALSNFYQVPQSAHHLENGNQNEYYNYQQEEMHLAQMPAVIHQPAFQPLQQQSGPYIHGPQLPPNPNQPEYQNLYQQPPPKEQQGFTVKDFDEESQLSSPTPSNRSNQTPGKPKIDFLARNRKDFTRTVPQAMNSYSNSYLERKKKKENIPPSPMLGKKRGPVKAKHPDQVENENTGTFIVEDEKPRTAETVWSKRTQSLKAVRSEKTGKGKRNPLRKYPSESRVDDMKQTVSSAPPKLQPIKGSPRQAFTEPLRTEIEVDPAKVGKGPVRHTVFTDDGQRVSVDINLKLVSPGPYYGGLYNPQFVHPAGPISQRPMYPVSQDRHTYNYHPALPAPPPHLQHQTPPHHPHHAQDHYEGYYSQPPLTSDRATPMSHRSNFTPAGGSPFKVLPPINPADIHPGERSLSQTSETGTYKVTPRRTVHDRRALQRRDEEQLPPKDDTSYLDQMRKARERKPVEFRRYTVDDYKKLKREVRLGGLGPDLDNDSLKDKREKREKQIEYAQKVKAKNQQEYKREIKRPTPKAEPEDDPKDDLLHRRNIALEYAKSVPKPKVRPTRTEPLEPRPSGPTVEKLPVTTIRQKPKKQVQIADDDMLDLATLRQRHEEEKQKAALIRQQIEAGQ